MKLIEYLTKAAMKNRQIVLTITFTLTVFGIYALSVMPRQEFPPIKIPTGVIVGVFPGATSEQVEEQLTSKVEEFLFSFQEVDRGKTYSISEEGMMYILVELRMDVNNRDSEIFWASFRHGLEELKMSLPQEVLALIANNKFGDAAALIMTLHSDQRTHKELEIYLETLEDEIRKLPSVSAIKHSGLQKEVIDIYIDNEKLAFYGINPLTLLAALKMESSVTFAGDIDNGKIAMPIHLPNRFKTENDLANLIVYTDPRGVTVRLGDIARVVREYEDPSSYVQIDGNNCVILTLEMMAGNNIVKFGEDIDEILERLSHEFPPDVEVNTIADMPKIVKGSVNTFIEEFFIAILAVVIVTIVLLPLRISLISALTIPISVMSSLGLLYAYGIELNTVSLAGLIIVLGMVVDNTIVIIDNYVEQLDRGIDRWTAAWKSVSELFIPVLTATLAIIASFAPMNAFLPGLMSDFFKPLPLTIVITLTISLLVASLLVPILTYSLIKTGLKSGKQSSKQFMLDKLQSKYDQLIELAFKHKRMVMLGAIAILILTGIIGSTIKNQFTIIFERNQFAVEIYLAEGTSLDVASKAADHLQQKLLLDERVEHVTAFIGTSSPRFHTLYAPNMPAPNYAQLIVNTVSNKATEEICEEYDRNYISPIPQAHCRWKRIAITRSAAPIEVRIAGDNIRDLKETAEQVKEIMRETEGIGWIRTDFEEPLQGVRLAVKEEETDRLGMSKGIIAYNIAAGLNGIPLAKVWEGDYPIDVVLKQEASSRTTLDDLMNINITSPYTVGSSVRSRQLVEPVLEWTEGSIIRRNGIRTLTVKADVESDVTISRVFKSLSEKVDAISPPAGVNMYYGGDRADQIENNTPFVHSLLFSICLIFFILLFQFKTVRITFIIMSLVPLCFFGALIGLLLTNYPFGSTVLIGIIGLVGMVIRNGIIYIDYAEYLRTEKGIPLDEAAIAAGKRRMRPIYLTAMAAAVGVIPMIMSRSPLWGPLGAVICFGLLFTMVLSLIVLPVVYAVFGPREKKQTKPPVPAATTTIILCLAFLLGAGQSLNAQTTLTLDECKDLALKNNVELKNSAEELNAANSMKRKAFTAYFPDVSATGMAMHSIDPLMEFEMEGGDLPVYDGDPDNLESATEYAYFPGFSLSAGEDIYTGALTVMQPVFTGGRIRKGNRLASLGVDVRKTMHELAEKDVIIQTEQQYWRIVSLDEKLKTLNAYEELLIDLEDQVSDAYNAGLILKNDLLKVQLKLSEVRLNKSRLLNGKHLAMMSFCQFIGVPFDSTSKLESDLTGDISASVMMKDHKQALRARGEYRLLEKSVQAAHLQTAMTIGENLPAVALGLTSFYMKADDYDAIDNTIGFVSVQIPLSGWWGGSHDIAEHRAQERIALNKQSDSEKLLLLQMDKTWKDLEEARESYSLSLLTQAQAEDNVEVTRDSYENGLVTVSDLLEAQALLQEADDRVTDAKIDLRIRTLLYRRVTGEL